MSFVFMMESTYRDLSTRTLSLLEQSGNYRILILLIGAPGSGKSTIAQRVVDILNEQHKLQGSHHSDKVIQGGDLSHFNDALPPYDPTQSINVEDENYKPTRDSQDDDTLIIRGRGGDDTALKITHHNDTDSQYIPPFAQVIPMDGFHLPRAVLRQFTDSQTAIIRRGSPFTFDSSLVAHLVSTLNETLQVPSQGLSPLDTAETQIPDIYIPSFDHAEHDPLQYGARIHSSSRVLIMEGLYLLLDNPVWRDIARCLEPNVERESVDSNNDSKSERVIANDILSIPVPKGKSHEFWKILIEDEKMLQRVGKRHLKAGIVETLELGEERVKFNDLPNGKKVYKESFKSDLNIISIDDTNEA